MCSSDHLSTATGLVVFGNDAEEFEAVDGISGRSLWHFNLGQQVHASPMSYAVDGVQYFAIAAGSDLFTFALPKQTIHAGVQKRD